MKVLPWLGIAVLAACAGAQAQGIHKSEPLGRFVELLETALGQRATIEYAPMQPGDVKETYADIESATRDFGFKPTVPIDVGLPRFVDWYRAYHGSGA